MGARDIGKKGGCGGAGGQAPRCSTLNVLYRSPEEDRQQGSKEGSVEGGRTGGQQRRRPVKLALLVTSTGSIVTTVKGRWKQG